MPGTYYNEWDSKAAAWLRELIRCGHLPDGEVDERSIADVDPGDLAGFRACHFFAGIGGWPYALRLAGWPDDRPVWTGSCPCPPFSAAGKGHECPSCGSKRALSHPFITAGWVCLDCEHEWRGDTRHLAPELIRLIGQCRPPVVFGEQVASAAGRVWLASLRAVLERVGYATGAADLCSAGFRGAHIRQRLYFGAVRLADAEGDRGERESERFRSKAFEPEPRWAWQSSRLVGCERPQNCGGLAHADGGHTCEAGSVQRGREHGCQPQDGGALRSGGGGPRADVGRSASGPRAPLYGWHDADWLRCRDGKWRPVEPGAFPLADEIPARVVRLRGYGNAIDPEVAAAFIEAFDEAGGVT